ncbi:MAG: B12-binding domain-containing radical SAM protein, partial [Bacteroidota bacterium]
DHKDYPQVNHFILNEAEITLPVFLADLKKGQPKRLYQTDKYADMSLSPVPDYHLLNLKAYAFMNLQVSRGCPFNCDFCEITALLGRKVRMKTRRQLVNELQTLYELKWRGPVSVVDDNFIGNRKSVKNDILPAMIKWMREHKYPFSFNAQTSIDLADDDQLLELMSSAGFNSTFIGIETPDEESLQSCHKVQNENRNLLESVQKIQSNGLMVSGGFIVGFDSDKLSVFQKQIDFIQQSGIVSAMVGLLNAPKNTRLYKHLEKENRLTIATTGNNTDFTMNFIPKMKTGELLQGYRHIITSIYQEKAYYKRIRKLLLNYKPVKNGRSNVDLPRIKAFLRSVFVLGVASKGRREYWKFIFWSLIKKPRLFIEAITMAVYGYHFRTIYGLRDK